MVIGVHLEFSEENDDNFVLHHVMSNSCHTFVNPHYAGERKKSDNTWHSWDGTSEADEVGEQSQEILVVRLEEVQTSMKRRTRSLVR